MTRITGMVLGLGLLVGISSLASPASAWDGDDDDHHHRRSHRHSRWYGDVDDDDFKRRHRHHHHGFGHGISRPPIYFPPPAWSPGYYDGHFSPRYESIPHTPVVPSPAPPSEVLGPDFSNPQTAVQPVLPPLPPETVLPQSGAGQFVSSQVPLFPRVRVKDGEKAARFGVNQVIAVRSPDPVRFPGLVYVQVRVPAQPGKVKVEDGGAKVKLDYEDHEVEIQSKRGVVTIEYDD